MRKAVTPSPRAAGEEGARARQVKSAHPCSWWYDEEEESIQRSRDPYAANGACGVCSMVLARRRARFEKGMEQARSEAVNAEAHAAARQNGACIQNMSQVFGRKASARFPAGGRDRMPPACGRVLAERAPFFSGAFSAEGKGSGTRVLPSRALRWRRAGRQAARRSRQGGTNPCNAVGVERARLKRITVLVQRY